MYLATVYAYLTLLVIQAQQYLCDDTIEEIKPVPMPNLPPSIRVNFSNYENWAGEIKTSAWVAYPENAEQILELANWARKSSIKLRPSGYRHSWSPMTIQKSDNALVIDTTTHLTKMGIISSTPGNSSFWVEPGLSVISILTQLEAANLSLASFPAVGEISIGGALAVGAHGLGIHSEGKPSGHTFGALSNLIIELTAVVFDPISDSYVLKKFHRSDPEAKAFLINFGRSFITNVTLRAGPLIHLHCQSFFQYPPETVFAPSKIPNSMASIQETNSRVEVFYVAHLNLLWVLKLNMSEEKPPEAVHALNPYNFGKNIFAPDVLNSMNIWGTPKNMLLFLHQDSPRFSDGSWAVVTSETNLQNVIHNAYRLFQETREMFEEELTEIVFEMRLITVDDPNDVGVEGAENPGLGQFHPIDGRSDMNIVVIFEVASTAVVTLPEGQLILKFYIEYEKKLLDHFNDEEAIFRVEWSKGWGFSNEGPNTNRDLVKSVKTRGKFGPRKYSVEILNKYDPWRVFTSPFTDMILE